VRSSHQCKVANLVAVAIPRYTWSLHRAIAMSGEIHSYIQHQLQIHHALRVQHSRMG
jgi:hypothetical protein